MNCFQTKGLEPRHVFYGLTSGIWLALSAVSSSTYPFASPLGDPTVDGIVQSLFFALSFFGIAVFSRKHDVAGRYLLGLVAVSGVVISLVLALLSLSFIWPGVLLGASLILALARASGFCQLLCMLERFERPTAKKVLFLGSIVTTLLTLLHALLGDPIRQCVITFCIYAPVGALTLLLNVRIQNAHLGCDRAFNAPAVHPIAPVHGSIRAMTLPILCIIAITLITPIAMGAFNSSIATSRAMSLVAPLSHALGLIILGIVWLGARKDVSLPVLYSVYLPAFTISVLLASAFQGLATLGIIVVGDTGYFFVSLFMVTTALSIAHEQDIGALFVYGIFAGFLYLTDAVQMAVRALSASGALDLQPYVMFMLIAYVLAIPICYIALPLIIKGHDNLPVSPESNRSERVARLAFTETSTQIDSDNATRRALTCIGVSYSLSERQQQVMELLVSGRSAERISETLGLAPNTVRSYRKSLYASLGVHGLQELLDLVDEEKDRIEKASI